MTVFSRVPSKGLNICDRKFLTTKKRQKHLWIQANIFWGLGKRQIFPQHHLWCSTVQNKKSLQAGMLHMQSVQKRNWCKQPWQIFLKPNDHWLKYVNCIMRYTHVNKNSLAWNFLSPKPEVTSGTVAIIIQVVLLSPYLRIRAVSLSSIHYNQSHRVYINRRRQYSCLIWN